MTTARFPRSGFFLCHSPYGHIIKEGIEKRDCVMNKSDKTRFEKINFIIEKLKLPYLAHFIKNNSEELGSSQNIKGLQSFILGKFYMILSEHYKQMSNEEVDLLFDFCSDERFLHIMDIFPPIDENAYHAILEYWDAIVGGEDRGRYLH